VLCLHPGDRLVGHINGKMITGFVRRLYPDGAIKNGRRPLIRFATDKTVKLIETGMSRPTIKWPGNRDLPWRRLVILTKGRGAVAIKSQHLRDWCHALRTDSGVRGKCCGQLHDRVRAVHVMIASR